MSLVNLAVVVVFVTNAAVLLLLVYLLVRILGQTEQTRFMMVGAARELMDSARVVRDAGYQVTDALRALGGRTGGPAVSATPVAGLEMLERLDQVVAELTSAGRGQASDQAFADVRQVVDGMRGADPAQVADWYMQHKAEREQATAQLDLLMQESDQMRRQLAEAHRVIEALRRANRAASDAGETVESLRGEVEKQRQMLLRAKQRVQAAEERAGALSAEVERLGANAPAGAPESEALDEARRRLAEVAGERDRHLRELDKLQDAMKRTLVEKDFIEEHFLRLDGQRTAADAAAAAPADPDAGAGTAAARVSPADAAALSRQNDALMPT